MTFVHKYMSVLQFDWQSQLQIQIRWCMNTRNILIKTYCMDGPFPCLCERWGLGMILVIKLLLDQSN